MTHLQEEQIEDVGETPDLPAYHPVAACDPHPKLDCGLDLGDTAGADAGGALLQLDGAECEESMEPTSRDQQALSSFETRYVQ